MRIVLVIALLLAGLLPGLISSESLEAAVSSLTIGYDCSDGKANLNIAWEGSNPQGSDIYIDLGPAPGLPEGTYENRSVPSDRRGYRWTGLEPGTTYYVRINQQVNGQWEPSSIFSLATPCTGRPAPSVATLKVLGFSEQFVARGGGVPHNIVPSGGTLQACPPRMVIYVDVSGLAGPTSFLVSWSGPAMDRSVEFTVPATAPIEPFSWVAPSGGYKDGNYTFRLLSGSGSNRQKDVEGTVSVICGGS